MRVILGIDPGNYGGFAIIKNDAECSVFAMPKQWEQEQMLNYFKEANTIFPSLKVIIERPIIKPHFISKLCPRCKAPIKTSVLQQGIMTSLINYGILIGVIKTLGIAFEEVESAKWKKYFKLNKDKKTSVKLAKELFPSLISDIGSNDGIAEALLIAEYGRRNL